MDFVMDVTWMCPVTRLYRADDGQHYAVSCCDFFTAQHTEVFLADERGIAIDADGDPANGLTALVRWDEQLTHDEAVSRLAKFLTWFQVRDGSAPPSSSTSAAAPNRTAAS